MVVVDTADLEQIGRIGVHRREQVPLRPGIGVGIEEEARDAAAVLGHNFPGSDWYVDSYALLTGERVKQTQEPEGFLGRNFRKIVEGDIF